MITAKLFHHKKKRKKEKKKDAPRSGARGIFFLRMPLIKKYFFTSVRPSNRPFVRFVFFESHLIRVCVDIEGA
jgi:hypothetical protein